MVFFVSAGNLMTMFLALEWFSISLYVLCALDTHRRESLEAGLKYLIVGSFGSGILLFGCALVYGATGELGFAAIQQATGADDPLFVTGMAMILAGLAFKVSAAPFHMWTPDVYQGAPTTVTAFMAAATKVAGLVLMLRLLVTAFPEQSEIWTIAVAALAVASLVIGNLAAIAQRDVKRMLAYSSVSHAGFLLIAIAANNAEGGATALLYYLVPYVAATVGAFAVVAARERELARPGHAASARRARLGAAVPRRRHVGVRAQHGRVPAHRRLPRQAVRLLRRSTTRAGGGSSSSASLATALSLAYYLAIVRALFMRQGDLPGRRRRGGRLAAARPAARHRRSALALVVTIGSFFAVQPIVDLARDAVVASLTIAVGLPRRTPAALRRTRAVMSAWRSVSVMATTLTWLGHASFRLDTEAGTRALRRPVPLREPDLPRGRARARALRPRRPDARSRRPRRRHGRDRERDSTAPWSRQVELRGWLAGQGLPQDTAPGAEQGRHRSLRRRPRSRSPTRTTRRAPTRTTRSSTSASPAASCSGRTTGRRSTSPGTRTSSATWR